LDDLRSRGERMLDRVRARLVAREGDLRHFVARDADLREPRAQLLAQLAQRLWLRGQADRQVTRRRERAERDQRDVVARALALCLADECVDEQAELRRAAPDEVRQA